jgi:flagellar biosynthesis protein FliR
MAVHIDIAWILAALLLSVRIAAALAFAPVFGMATVPGQIKVLLAVALGAYLVAGLLPGQQSVVPSLSVLAVATLREAVIGLAFGFGLMVAYAATQVAGRALDIQIGFGAASILNPATQSFAPLVGSIFGIALLVVFMALDGHHLLLRALAGSIRAYPPAAAGLPALTDVITQAGTMFSFSLSLAAPVMFLLWLSDIAMAVMARSMPQLNVFVLGFAVKIVLGISGLALSIGLTRQLFAGLLGSTASYWERLQVP